MALSDLPASYVIWHHVHMHGRREGGFHWHSHHICLPKVTLHIAAGLGQTGSYMGTSCKWQRFGRQILPECKRLQREWHPVPLFNPTYTLGGIRGHCSFVFTEWLIDNTHKLVQHQAYQKGRNGEDKRGIKFATAAFRYMCRTFVQQGACTSFSAHSDVALQYQAAVMSSLSFVSQVTR